MHNGCHINPGESIKLGHQSLWGILKTDLLKCKPNLSCGHREHNGQYCTATVK